MKKILVTTLVAASFLIAPSAFACAKSSCAGKDGGKCECTGGCECGKKAEVATEDKKE